MKRHILFVNSTTEIRKFAMFNNKIKEKDLNEIVLQKLSQRLRYLQLHQYAKDVKALKDRQNTELSGIKKIKNEISRLESNFKVLYSKKVEGIITKKNLEKNIMLIMKRLLNLKIK